MKYTKDDNIKVMKCYYLSEPSKRGYIKRMARIWRELSGFELTEGRLTTIQNSKDYTEKDVVDSGGAG